MEQEINQLREQLQKQEKLASLGILSAGIAHEIQNPLNFVINFSKMSDKLLKDLTEIVEDNEDKLPEEDREDLEDIVADLKENMEKIVASSVVSCLSRAARKTSISRLTSASWRKNMSG